MLALLRTFSWQDLRHHPWRSAAAVAAVMLGVALAFAVHVINASALDEFSQAVRAVNGQPDLEVRPMQGTLGEDLFAQVATHPDVARANPVLEATAMASPAVHTSPATAPTALRLLGADALLLPAMAPALMPRPWEGAARDALFAPATVYLNPAALQALGVPLEGAQPRPTLRLQTGLHTLAVQVAGTVSAPGAPLAVMDIGAAQDLLGRVGQLTRIDLQLQPGTDRSAFQQALQALPGWPAQATLAEPGDAAQRVSNLSRAYRVNLTVLALVALFTGAFLVFSVLALSVAQRGPQFALLAVLGATPRQRLALVLAESALLGVAGSLAGLALGTALASAALQLLGGDLGRRGIDDDIMNEHGIKPIDLVAVNLYPFEATISKPGCDLPTAIENIDIGGPTMVRSAAKNHKDVAIVVNASDYANVLENLKAGGLTYAQRFDLMLKAFEHTAAYDGMIANYLGTVNQAAETLSTEDRGQFPRTFNSQFIKAQEMRYGENPHQKAAFYVEAKPAEVSIATATQLQGKELSFNNVADTDAALECVKSFVKPACVIVKHANPCGVAVSPDAEGGIRQAYELAYATDTESAFGGIIAFNRELDAETAKAIVERQFVEVIIAPSVSEEARAIVAAKANVRLLACGQWSENRAPAWDFKRVNGGLLVQSRDIEMIGSEDLKVVTQRAPTEQEIHDLIFAWKVAKYVKSNAIVYAKGRQTIGVGAGQMSRVNSARIAAIKAEHAGLQVQGAVMASDAFFPFRDGIDNAAKAGITAVIQPGGSMRDNEVIAAADEAGIAMVFTGMRHFRH